MIKKLEGFDKYVALVGFTDVKIFDVDSFLNMVRDKIENACVQFFDARVVAGWEHLYFAALNALNAFKNKLNVSNNLAVEALLFASGQRQIKKAVELMGIKPEISGVAVLILAETRRKAEEALEILSNSMSGEHDDGVLEVTDEKIGCLRELFDISDLELEASRSLVDLVIEHVALSITKR